MEETKKISNDSTHSDIEFSTLLKTIWREKYVAIFLVFLSAYLGLVYIEKFSKETYSARAVFGFNQTSQKNSVMQQLSNFSGVLGAPTVNHDILSQIYGGEFLRKIVRNLKLTQNQQFKMSQKVSKGVAAKVKGLLKVALALETKPLRNFSEPEKVELVVKSLRKNHLTITKLKTGGYEIVVTMANPETAALIANTIATEYLKLRLKTKILKSDKALAYLSEKLSIAKNEMENSNQEAAVFALERNILSSQEFVVQSNRLKEFRVTITKLKNTLKNLTDHEVYFISSDVLNRPLAELQRKIQILFDTAPRIWSMKRLGNLSSMAGVKKEVIHLKVNLPKEINRIAESLRVTLNGFKNLEKKAKETSLDAREYKSVEKNALIRSGRYDVLLKQFEAQSVLEGYQDALGEIYESALPPLYPSKPNRTWIMQISLVFGLFFGIAGALIKSSLSFKVWSKNEFDKVLGLKTSINVSKSLLNIHKIISVITLNRFSPEQKRDALMLQGFISGLEKEKNGHLPLIVACAATQDKNSSQGLAVLLAKLFTMQKKKVLLIDFSSNSKLILKTSASLPAGASSEETNLISLNQDIAYAKSTSLENEGLEYISTKNFKAEFNEFDVFIKIISKIEQEPQNIKETIDSDFFFLTSQAGQVTSKDLERVQHAIGKQISKCVSGVFVS